MRGFRYWLADLISGGELTRQTNGWRLSEAHNSTLRYTEHKMWIDLCNNRSELADMMADKRGCEKSRNKTYKDRLARIAALETPSSNATEREMANIARGDA